MHKWALEAVADAWLSWMPPFTYIRTIKGVLKQVFSMVNKCDQWGWVDKGARAKYCFFTNSMKLTITLHSALPHSQHLFLNPRNPLCHVCAPWSRDHCYWLAFFHDFPVRQPCPLSMSTPLFNYCCLQHDYTECVRLCYPFQVFAHFAAKRVFTLLKGLKLAVKTETPTKRKY